MGAAHGPRTTAWFMTWPGRGLRLARRALLSSLHRIYARVIAVPLLRWYEKVGRASIGMPAFGAVPIYDRTRFFKVALAEPSPIEREYGNWESAMRVYPALAAVLPEYRMGNHRLVRYISMPRYTPVDPATGVEHARDAYEQMRSCSMQHQRLRISDSEELLEGLRVIGGLYGEAVHEKLRWAVCSFLADGHYHVGFAHGDFHARNIVVDDTGFSRIVDLDCARLAGVQELDALYFTLEWQWSHSRRLWYESLVSYFRGEIPADAAHLLDAFGVEYSHGLAVTYLADRVGQETLRYDFLYARKQLDPVMAAAEWLLDGDPVLGRRQE
jgi:hypothetical protein